MALRIGIVGCSAEGAALCYRTICQEGPQSMGEHAHPEVTMHTFPLADYMKRIERGDWQGVGEMMIASGRKLAKAGADFLICPDNTVHQALRFVELRSGLPWMHIADVVAGEASKRHYKKVGLLGTRWLVESEVYPDKLAARWIEMVRPLDAERLEVNRIIMEELVSGEFKPQAVAYCQKVIRRMQEEGCDAVVLGCTELPLILDDGNSPLPVLDSTRLLARAALRRALAGRREDREEEAAADV
jgi:aspartate racemase